MIQQIYIIIRALGTKFLTNLQINGMFSKI